MSLIQCKDAITDQSHQVTITGQATGRGLVAVAFALAYGLHAIADAIRFTR